jgi:hypothetical protein
VQFEAVVGDVVAETVEEKKGIGFGRVAESEGAAEMYACEVHRRFLSEPTVSLV